MYKGLVTGRIVSIKRSLALFQKPSAFLKLAGVFSLVMTLTVFLLLLATPGTIPFNKLKHSVLQVTLQAQEEYSV